MTAIVAALAGGCWLLLGRRSINKRKEAGQELTEKDIVLQVIAGPVRVDRLDFS